jgi:hypothetical protein
MNIGGVHEVIERLFREGTLSRGSHSLILISREKRKIRNIKTGGATPNIVTIFH